MLILFVVCLCIAAFLAGFLFGDWGSDKIIDDALEELDKAGRMLAEAGRMLAEAEKHLSESIKREETARGYLREANEALEKVDALRREEIAGGAWVEIGGSYEEPPKAAGSSPSRDPERGADRAEECGAVCGSDAAGSGEADREERSEA